MTRTNTEYVTYDYLAYQERCASVESANLRVGDVVWAPAHDPMNPWRELVTITSVLGNGWYDADSGLGFPQLRWFPTTTLFYMARTTAEATLAQDACRGCQVAWGGTCGTHLAR